MLSSSRLENLKNKQIMKQLIVFVGSFIITISTFSQAVDFNKIILPDNAGSNIEFEEKLVQLAWKNHPGNRLLYNNLAAAQYETKIASAEWWNIIRLSGNINEFNIPGATDPNNRSQFYPRYNIGAIIPLGIFKSIPNQVKQNQELEQVAMHNINTQKLAIRSEVLKLYNEFLMYKEIFSLRSQELEESTASFVLLEQRFKSGEEQYDKYTQGLSLLNRVKIERVQSQTNYLNTKLALEEYIGVRLEDVK